MSGGEKQLLAFGNILIHSPKLILLDEPFAGVDTTGSEVLTSLIRSMNNNNISFIIVEHRKHHFDNFQYTEKQLKLGIL